jgi:hypothetical protein
VLEGGGWTRLFGAPLRVWVAQPRSEARCWNEDAAFCSDSEGLAGAGTVAALSCSYIELWYPLAPTRWKKVV